ncbi:MAG: hypothetical protein J6C43_01575, partial [Oscillospiraceae bacterium]|nr:hypothetical protein [Oscillospiraceae bacterium]
GGLTAGQPGADDGDAFHGASSFKNILKAIYYIFFSQGPSFREKNWPPGPPRKAIANLTSGGSLNTTRGSFCAAAADNNVTFSLFR